MIPMAMANPIRTTVLVLKDLYTALAKAAGSDHASTASVMRDALRGCGAKHGVKRVKTQ